MTSFARSSTRRSVATLGCILLLACHGTAARGQSAGGDLSGVWRLDLSARTRDGDFYCRMLPVFTESLIDTVHDADTVEELVVAIVPDSLDAAFSEVCAITPLGGTGRQFEGDAARVACALSAALVSTCSLTVRFDLIVRRAGADSVGGRGRGVGTLHGGCPDAACPGEVVVGLRRLARLSH